MSITKQDPNGKGSLQAIQDMVNKHPDLLNYLIKMKVKGLQGSGIVWKSPLATDSYAEYSDQDFLNILGINNSTELLQFWPKRGAHWDGLAVSDKGDIILVEAKANIPELKSPATRATGNSKILIDKSIRELKAYLSVQNSVDWTDTFYQYTNRIAHLYFLKEKLQKNAYLINLYFINDKSVAGPTSENDWIKEIEKMKQYLGIHSGHKLDEFMVDIFVDLDAL